MKLSRRRFLRLGLAGGVALALPLGAPACSGRSDDPTGNLLPSEVTLPDPFGVPLPVPPILEPVRSDGDADLYEITQKVVRAEILPGLETEIWAYNGIFPGPTIEARSGRVAVVRHRNELPVPTVVHLHGGVTPPEHDGYATDVVAPAGGHGSQHASGHGGHAAGLNVIGDGLFDYQYPNGQRAATLWYHDHRMDFTGPQVYRGLAGFHIVRDAEEDALPLPAGAEKDVPLMICDRSFAEDGSFLYPSRDPSLMGEPGVTDAYVQGVFGDVVLVNGAPWPEMEVSNTKHRFRILNASNARRYELALDPEPTEGSPFVQVGSDGGLLGAPVAHRTIPIAPAERFDVVVDFARYGVGTRVTLKNRLGDGGTADIMRFRVVREEEEESAVPDKLSDMTEFDALGETAAVPTRRFRFTLSAGGDGTMWTINGEPFDPERIDARPTLGSAEIWEFVTDVHHPVHLHLAHFKVLSRQGQQPLRKDVGWKDTVDLPPGQLARVLCRFDGYRGKYVFHCHNLEHEDMMMMANFEVV